MSSQSAVSEVPASPSEPAAKSSKSPDKSSESIVKDGEKRPAAQSIQQFASTAMAPFKSKIIPKDFVEDRQIVVVGSVNADICLQIERMPEEGECLNCEAQKDESGKNLGGRK